VPQPKSTFAYLGASMKRIFFLLIFLCSMAQAGIGGWSGNGITCLVNGTFVGRSAGVMGCYAPAGGGDVVSPGVAVVGDIATFGDIAGTTLLDSGVAGNNLCLLTGNQTVAGVKTFSSFPVVPLTSGNLIVGSAGNLGASVAVSGDLTAVASGAFTIANLAVTTAKINTNAVTLAKMATQADQTFLGNISGGSAVPSALTATQTTAALNIFTASGVGHLKGLVPDPGGSSGSTKFLREDATWAIPGGGGGVAWGSITGTLSAQTDLQAELDAKANTIAPIFTGQSSFSIGSNANPGIILGLASDNTGISSVGAANRISLDILGAQAATFSATQTGLGNYVFLNTIGTPGTNNVISANTATDTLLLTGNLNGTTGDGGGIKLGGNSTDTTEFWNAGTMTANFDASNNVYLPTIPATSTAQTGTVCWSSTGGKLTVDTTVACLASIRRIKENIQPLDIGLDAVMKLQPISYNLKKEYNPQHLGKQVGFIAEDVQQVDDRLVGKAPNGDLTGVRYMQMAAVLTRAIQQQQTQIAVLQAEIKDLRGHLKP
jgi:hypothetical protein